MPRGTILTLDDREFGSVSRDWQTAFFHRSAVEEGEYRFLSIGKNVAYELAQSADLRFSMPQARIVRMK